MTIAIEDTKEVFTGNGSTTVFSFDFKTNAAADLLVVLTNDAGAESVLLLNTHYSVSLNANQNSNPGGTVTYPLSGAALRATERLTVARDAAFTQPTAFTLGVHPRTLETKLDNLTMFTQQLLERSDRSLRLAISDALTPTTDLGTAEQRASKFLHFDANGIPELIAATGLSPAAPTGSVVDTSANLIPGTTDMTTVFALALAAGGDIYIPEGTYNIAGAGPDTGGVAVVLTKNTRIRCHPNAVFVTDSLDNDMMRFTVPSNGAGLPADGVVFEWYGGTFDQRNQKTSTVVPFIAQYPPSNPGVSATADGLSIRGDYSVMGTEFHGIRRAHVQGVTFIAGAHWESSGGDSGLFISGAALQTVYDCRAIGSRDLGVYASGGVGGTLDCKTVIRDCLFVNCFFGASIKRSSGDSEIVANTAHNCVRGFLASHVTGNGFNRLRISQNTGRNVGIGVELDECIGYDVSDNHFNTLGALLEDGATVEPVAGCNGIELNGCLYGAVKYNTVNGIQTGVAAAYPAGYMLVRLDTHAVTSTQCQHNQIRANFGNGLRTAGADVGGNANSYIENYVLNADTSANFSVVGTNYFEIRVDPGTQRRSVNTPLGFADGTASAPIIVRNGEPSVGMRFGAAQIGLCIGSNDAIRVDDTNTGGNTRLLVYDVTSGATQRVSVGANDSESAGFRSLRIPNA